MKLILAIDPGSNGGYAVKGCGTSAEKLPSTEGDIISEFRNIKEICDQEGYEAIAVIEDVPKYCGKAVPSSSIFTLARSFGFLIGTLQTLGFRVELVRPQEWQGGLGLGSRGGMTTTQWKNKLKAVAQRLYPSIKVTLATSDALLILEYATKKAL